MDKLHPSPYYILFYGGGFFVSSGDTKNGCTGAKNHAEYQNTKSYRKNHSAKKIRADKKSAVLYLQGNKKKSMKRENTPGTRTYRPATVYEEE
ncbi:hypothetical protein [uncultured Prevotella sp.]|uniref:hypothetical protein n=1 Tax=uncultured Prevotella sp. TaxID=159272 RepID=UPI0025D86130|nr:hypothetical protein [uncultured Prevotella sp.]